MDDAYSLITVALIRRMDELKTFSIMKSQCHCSGQRNVTTNNGADIIFSVSRGKNFLQYIGLHITLCAKILFFTLHVISFALYHVLRYCFHFYHLHYWLRISALSLGKQHFLREFHGTATCYFMHLIAFHSSQKILN